MHSPYIEMLREIGRDRMALKRQRATATRAQRLAIAWGLMELTDHAHFMMGLWAMWRRTGLVAR